jgi:hypothetical protein
MDFELLKANEQFIIKKEELTKQIKYYKSIWNKIEIKCVSLQQMLIFTYMGKNLICVKFNS